VLQSLAGNLTVDGRDLKFDNVTGQLFGGTVIGSLEAKVAATPNYRARANVSGVDVAALTGGEQPTAAPFGGTDSGEVDFSMQGTARNDLAESLACNGTLDVRGAEWRGIALLESLVAAKSVAAKSMAGNSAFSEASGEFACADGSVTLKNVVLMGDGSEIDGSGSVDFTPQLDLQMRVVPDEQRGVGPVPSLASGPQDSVRVTGTVEAPEFSKATPGRRSR
jgi:hypothetical protein